MVSVVHWAAVKEFNELIRVDHAEPDPQEWSRVNEVADEI